VETFHVVCEYKTAAYFNRCIWYQRLSVLTISIPLELIVSLIATADRLRLQLIIEAEQDLKLDFHLYNTWAKYYKVHLNFKCNKKALGIRKESY